MREGWSEVSVPTVENAVTRRTERVVEALCGQALACEKLGSRMYADLMSRAAADPEPVVTALGAHASGTDPFGPAVVLRLFGAVHRLVLSGRLPKLATHYPSVGGRYQGEHTWTALRSVLVSHRDTIVSMLTAPPQTNEVGRSAALIGGLLHVAARTRMPIRLLEVGASAGLNLRPDLYRYEYGRGRSYGPDATPTVIRHAWSSGGALPPLEAPLRIVERAGCDPNPVDPTTDEGRLTLMSFIWPDQTERFARTRGACTLAAGTPATLLQMDGSKFLEDLAPRRGVATVVWHSVVRQYVPVEEWERTEAALARAGAQATPDAPVAHLSLEPRIRGERVDFPLTLRLWPGERAEILGITHAHGTPVTWRECAKATPPTP